MKNSVTNPVQRSSAVFAVVLCAFASVAVGQDQRADEPNWGTGTSAMQNISAIGFQSIGDATSMYDMMLAARFRTGGTTSGLFAAPVQLPAGAQVMGVEAVVCDTFASFDIVARFTLVNIMGPFYFGVSQTTGTPGCVTIGSPTNIQSSNVFVDNAANTYQAEVSLSALNSTTRFQAVRVYYKLRVSPGPATATFTDVPTTHPLFRFVEALAASGITGGCGASLYCPDANLTRGQMAVFLSTALGLHFAN